MATGSQQAVACSKAAAAAQGVVLKLAQDHRNILDQFHAFQVSADHNRDSLAKDHDHDWFKTMAYELAKWLASYCDEGWPKLQAGAKAMVLGCEGLETLFGEIAIEVLDLLLDQAMPIPAKAELAKKLSSSIDALIKGADMAEAQVIKMHGNLQALRAEAVKQHERLIGDLKASYQASENRRRALRSEIQDLQKQLGIAFSSQPGLFTAGSFGLGLCSIVGCEKVGTDLISSGDLAGFGADSDAPKLADQLAGKVNAMVNLLDAAVYVKNVTMFTPYISHFETLDHMLTTVEGLFLFVTGQVAAIQYDLQLLINLGKSIYNPAWLNVLTQQVTLMKTYSQQVADLFTVYKTELSKSVAFK